MSAAPTPKQGPRSWVTITTALEKKMGPGRRAGTWTQFCCPVHENDGRRHRPSLAVKHLDDMAKTKVKCYAGCTDEQVLEKLDLDVKDLYDRPAAPGRRVGKPAVKPAPVVSRAEQALEAADLPAMSHKPELGRQKSSWRMVEAYEYARADGTIAGVVQRREAAFEGGRGKEFSQRAWNAETGRWEHHGFDRIPFRLPQVREAIDDADRVIYVCEGEKDVHAAESAGLTATTNVGGALSWTPEHAQHLAGVHTVVIVVDHDGPGYRRAEKVMDSLTGIAQRVRVVGAATGKDMHDHLQCGHEIADLVPIAGLDPFTPIPAPATEATASPTLGGTPDMPDYLLMPSGEAPVQHSDELGDMGRHWGQFVQMLFAKVMAAALAAAERRRQDIEREAARSAEHERAEKHRQEIQRKAIEAKLKKAFDSGLDNVGREQLAALIKDAATVSAESPLAQDGLARMAAHVKTRYGLTIDLATGQVSPTEQVAAAPELAAALKAAEGERADGARVKTAQERMVEMIARQPNLSEETKTEIYAAVEAWRLNPGATQLDALTKKLAGAKVEQPVRHQIRLVAAYLGQPGSVEALSGATTFETAMATREMRRLPPLVDAGEEAKARIDGLLVRYQDALRAGGPTDGIRERLAGEVSVLTPEDQKIARARGVAIRDNPDVRLKPLWPNHVDRAELADTVQMYAVLSAQAERITAEGGSLEAVADDGVVKRAAANKKKITDVLAHGEGLHPLEKDQLCAVLVDIHAGKTKVPALMFVDDRSAAHADHTRAQVYASDNARVTRRKVERVLESSAAPEGTVRRARNQVSAVVDAHVQLGSGRISLTEHEQSLRLEKLDVHLSGLGVPEALRNQVRGVFEASREEAAIDGKQARRIADVWGGREDGIAKQRMPTKVQHSYDPHERAAAMKRGLQQVGLSADEILQQVAAESGREPAPAEAAAQPTQRGGAGGMRSNAYGVHPEQDNGQSKGRGRGR
ncbi:toprim domain-containing protein [Nocardia sp. NPDC059195]|uniref:toprim domain-containing protein n=1 Tax=Nocardia sp. NPDC059195 TaxID=3346765 RepID=UPI0036A5F441